MRLFVASLVAVGVASLASANLLVNGSFENGDFQNNGGGADSLALGSTAITGWTTVSNELVWLNATNSYYVIPQDGSYSLDLTGYHDAYPYGGVSQTVSTVAGGKYHLSYYYGGLVLYSGNAGVEATAVDGSTSAVLLDQVNYDTFADNSNTYNRVDLDFVATGTSTIISFIGASPKGGTNYIGLDNVDLEGGSAVPEPASMIAISAGIAALVRRKRSS
ncbi:MAG: DUF642 domain-containing protein [Armatimonadetes bacterium]|nr:DUF642 domain-containing protein [Armatimonadota bacterium]